MFKNTAPWSEYVLIGRIIFKDAISKAELGIIMCVSGGLHACIHACVCVCRPESDFGYLRVHRLVKLLGQ